MILKKVFIIFCMFLLALIAVSAETTYNETGNYNSNFQQGTGFFNELLDLNLITTASRALNNPTYTPLVADLDNDGTNEIIILDGTIIRVYSGSALAIVDSFNLETDTRFSNFITFNIDSDSYSEIIIVGETNDILQIIEYNGTAMKNQTTLDLSALDNAGDEILIKCGKTENCLMAYGSAEAAGNMNVVGFNSTDLGDELTVHNDANARFCFPKIRSMSYKDYDNDATDEYIFSIKQSENIVEPPITIFYVDTLDNLTSVFEMKIDILTGLQSLGLDACSAGTPLFQNMLTSPLVFDFDNSPSNGLETAIGYMISLDDFIIRVFNSDGSVEDRHPAIFDGEGIIVSNMMLFNAFEDTGNEDYCVMGYDDVKEEIDLLCGSLLTSDLIQTREYEFDVSELTNITRTYGNWNVISHSAQHSTITTDGTNLNELINSYGVFRLVPSITNFLTYIFENPQQDAVVIPVDAEKAGREDLIVMQDDRLWYIDDGFTNTGGNISRYIINPCIDATWQVNTSVQVRITVTDLNGDNVAARAFLYLGQSFEQDSGWSANQSSGTTFSFSFIANHTIGSTILRLVGRDIGQPLQNTTIDLSISVGTEGVVFGECETDSGELLIVVDELDESETDLQDNALTSSFRTLGGIMGFSESLIYLIIMMIVAIGIWWQGSEHFPSQTFGVLIIVEVMLLIIGVKLDLIGTGILLTVILTFLIAIGLWASRFLMGSPQPK